MPACINIIKYKYTKPDQADHIKATVQRLCEWNEKTCAHVYQSLTFTEDADRMGYTCEAVIKDYQSLESMKALMSTYSNMDDFFIWDFPQNPKPELVVIKEESAVCKCAASDQEAIKVETDKRRPWTSFENADLDVSGHPVKFGWA